MIGREVETRIFRKAYASETSEFVAVYGRRRIGKTFLVNEVFNYRFAFHAAGIEGGVKNEQLKAFREALKHQGHPKCPRLTSWIAAFSELETLIESLPQGRKVIFLDELPWFDTPCSGFLKAFENFWNGWATSRRDVLLVICGSATTWITEKVLRARGGLHNRVTRQIPLFPFTLAECEKYAEYRHLGMDRRQLLECYMALGGVAYYWTLLEEGLSAEQNFDRLFFGASDEMRHEFDRLFASLFRRAERHVEVVRLLGTNKGGMTRDELLSGLGATSGSEISKCLGELVDCGFVRQYNMPARLRRGAVYQLVDPYVLFYFECIVPWRGNDPHHWTANGRSPAVAGWRGRAFERVCFAHIPQIRRALGISGVETDVYAWRWRSNDSEERGVQIDMLFDRADRIVDICEIKYSDDAYRLDKDEYERIRHRAAVFARESGCRKAVHTVLIASSGVSASKYLGNITQTVSGIDLFAE